VIALDNYTDRAMTEADKIPVEVAYALPDKQEIVMLEVPWGTTAAAAVQQSGIEKYFPGLELTDADLGIFGKAIKADRVLHAGDRVEIYRPLLADPKEIRKRRAAEAKERRAREKAGS
jgi:putative ubiquitin-RnfH superfamily antitoxin RatB of RatAB toxin-antitoxin module